MKTEDIYVSYGYCDILSVLFSRAVVVAYDGDP
jgi:hypothetical protein